MLVLVAHVSIRLTPWPLFDQPLLYCKYTPFQITPSIPSHTLLLTRHRPFPSGLISFYLLALEIRALSSQESFDFSPCCV